MSNFVETIRRLQMRKDYPRYTLRISKIMLDKLGYIAEHNGRTKNREIETLLKRHIAEYERMNGEIKIL